MAKRIKYPTRQRWLGEETGLKVDVVKPSPTPIDIAHRQRMIERNLLYGVLIVETLGEFKKKFNV